MKCRLLTIYQLYGLNIMHSEPSVVLVKTWVFLISSNEDQEIRSRAMELLLGAFGTMKDAMEFCERNSIAVKLGVQQ